MSVHRSRQGSWETVTIDVDASLQLRTCGAGYQRCSTSVASLHSGLTFRLNRLHNVATSPPLHEETVDFTCRLVLAQLFTSTDRRATSCLLEFSAIVQVISWKNGDRQL